MAAASDNLLGELRENALQGNWRKVLDIIRKNHTRQHGTPASALAAYDVLSLMKLKQYGAAADALARLGAMEPLPDMPQPSQGALASWAAFTLNYLGAQLLAQLNTVQMATDKLHGLLAACKQLAAPHAANTTQHRTSPATSTQDTQQQRQQQRDGPASAADRDVWLGRWRLVASCLVHLHFQEQQPAASFQLLDQLLLERPSDPWVWTTVGRLQLQLGHLQHAASSFNQAEKGFASLRPGHPPDREARRAMSHNNMCLKIMSLDLTGGLADCEMALVDDPHDAAAASNKALCLLHLGRLTEGVTLTEGELNRHPEAFLQEGVLSNLGFMYDLAYPGGNSSKQARHMVATASVPLVPDDFDLSCIEPPP